jgi:hypothetical protein
MKVAKQLSHVVADVMQVRQKPLQEAQLCPPTSMKNPAAAAVQLVADPLLPTQVRQLGMAKLQMAQVELSMER